MKRAFTTVELLVVVGIMTILFYGLVKGCRHCCRAATTPTTITEQPHKRVYTPKPLTTNKVKKVTAPQKSVSQQLREKNRKVPVYHITLEFSQRSFTLNIAQHIRNAANAFEFTFPTTKEFYDSVEENQELASNFKTASFILGGHIGSRVITVKRKFIQWAPAPQKGDD